MDPVTRRSPRVWPLSQQKGQPHVEAPADVATQGSWTQSHSVHCNCPWKKEKANLLSGKLRLLPRTGNVRRRVQR